MSKQINFYATDVDKTLITNILNSVFEQLIDIPYDKGIFSSFDPEKNKQRFYLAEKQRQSDILYHAHEYHDGSISEILDYRRSPVIEYSISFLNSDGAYVEGRFSCYSEDPDFSKKVSAFFAKFKKEFWYVKKWKTYISKNIDVENSLFFIPNRIIRIAKEDLK